MLSKDDLLLASSCINFNINMVQRVISRYYDSKLKNIGLTHNQFSMLAYFKLMDNVLSKELIQIFNIEQSSLSRNLRNLSDKNFIKMEIDKMDNRNKQISVTKLGEQILYDAYQIWILIHKDIEKNSGIDFNIMKKDLRTLKEYILSLE